MLESYVPGGVIDKEEMDQKAVIRAQWTRLSDFAEEVADRLSEVQGVFKRRLVVDVRGFGDDARRMRVEFERDGPMAPGVAPADAVARLARFTDEVGIMERRLDVLESGERLFGLRPTGCPELSKTKRELALLDSLYSLFSEVQAALEGCVAPMRAHWTYAYPHARPLDVCISPCAPIGRMRIPMRAHWTYAYPHARPLGVCISPCAPIGHMHISMRAGTALSRGRRSRTRS